MLPCIFEISHPGRQAHAQSPGCKTSVTDIPTHFLREKLPPWPECSELEVIRHYTALSQLNFCIDTHFYPLGSCTMKYNPRGVHRAASLPGFLNHHPLAPPSTQQGTLKALYTLQERLIEITGMHAISLTPMAGSQGEFAGVAMIKAYHASRDQSHRNIMLIPETAHGTNPASAALCGYEVIEIKTAPSGELCLVDLASHLNTHVAGIMLTNPSTLGLFMLQIDTIAKMIHDVGGLLYYDGANLNAILGQVRPGDMGFDVMHLNLHKTFATPHGSGGPGAGPIAANTTLAPFLPLPMVMRTKTGYRWADESDYPQSIGRLSTFMGNIGILLRAYFYISLLGREGLHRVAQLATLNANYLMKKLMDIGYEAAFPDRRATHEFILTLHALKKTYHITVTDVAKRLLDKGFHAPTTYFPLLIPECLLIEPTETESKETLDQYVEAMASILSEIRTNPLLLKNAPESLPVQRLDDVQAARVLNLNFFNHRE